jgi:hypothetical protein
MPFHISDFPSTPKFPGVNESLPACHSQVVYPAPNPVLGLKTVPLLRLWNRLVLYFRDLADLTAGPGTSLLELFSDWQRG